MALFKKQNNTLRISSTDWINGYLTTKIKAGENVSVDVEKNSDFGQQLVISANKSQGRRVLKLDVDGVVDSDVYLVLVDASKNLVKVTLPVAHDYLGQLSIVCVDPTHGIELVSNLSTQNVIFDTSSIAFHAKGDSITLVSDRGQSIPVEENLVEEENVSAPTDGLFPGTWYVVGRYAAQWYA